MGFTVSTVAKEVYIKKNIKSYSLGHNSNSGHRATSIRPGPVHQVFVADDAGHIQKFERKRFSFDIHITKNILCFTLNVFFGFL